MRKPAVYATEGRPNERRLIACMLPLIANLALASPAQAQISASVSLATSDMFRGESTSGDDAALGHQLGPRRSLANLEPQLVDEVEIGDPDARPLEGLPGGRHWPDAHHRRVDAAGRRRPRQASSS